ncbi:MAG: hypothetical protein IJY87_04585 [Bacilli bacterium]|nr:hypothetical protein [Bacilli bacterium]
MYEVILFILMVIFCIWGFKQLKKEQDLLYQYREREIGALETIAEALYIAYMLDKEGEENGNQDCINKCDEI